MPTQPRTTPNPRRVAAGKQNRLLRKGLSASGLERLRQAARQHRPWEHARGPRSARAKAQSICNGKRRQLGLQSIRELRQERKVWREILEDFQHSLQALEMLIKESRNPHELGNSGASGARQTGS